MFAISMNYYGYKLFNEKKIGLAYAKTLGKNISAGVQIDYINTAIAEGYGTSNAFTVEAGFIAKLTDELKFAVHIFNPSRAKLANYNNEKIPSIMKLGLGYSPNDKVIVSFETEKNIDADYLFKAGIEYHISTPLFIRVGVANTPLKSTFGIGLLLKDFKMDIAVDYHQILGFTPVVSLSYEIK